MKVISRIILAILLLLVSIFGGALSDQIKIEKPITYLLLIKQPIFWIIIVIVVVNEINIYCREKKNKEKKSEPNLKTKAARTQTLEIKKTKCIERLMEAATNKAIEGNFFDARRTMEMISALDSIMEVKDNGENKE